MVDYLIKDVDSRHLHLNRDVNYILLVNDDLKLSLELDGENHLIILNQASKDIRIQNTGTLKKDAYLKITYIDLSAHGLDLSSDISVDEGASLEVVLKILVATSKQVKMNYVNHKAHSSVLIDNSAIVLKNGDLYLCCTGDIKKGAHHSASHQHTRTLTFNEVKRALCIPELLIDEDEVEASHALSSGAIDEDILFYMQTRGLDEKAAMRLLIHSYLMLDEKIDQSLMDKLEKQVDEICMMY